MRTNAAFRRLVRLALTLLLTATGIAPARAVFGGDQAAPIRIGSKKFTESYVLGEIATRLLRERAGLRVEHRPGMGGTLILWQALRAGAIDAYPEYTGTISEEILKADGPWSAAAMRDSLARLGIGMSGELGFNNTYALVMRRERAVALGIRAIDDLRGHPKLKVGITPEFLGRRDGWAPLAARYGLRFNDVRGIEHGLGYAALKAGTIDLKECYSTDARIAQDSLVVLTDDLGYFPAYRAVFLFRQSMPPAALDALRALEGSLDEPRMQALNALAERTKDYAAAADAWFRAAPSSAVANAPASAAGVVPLVHRPAAPPRPAATHDRTTDLLRWTGQHLTLVLVSLLAAIAVGLPLGIRAARGDAAGQLILGVTGVIQTIPSLALLALLIPLVGIGARNASVALFLYSLLPIVRNTASGLADIPRPLRESTEALGLSAWARLRRVYLPMASRSILAGIQTSAVINVGTATLAGLIGGGGYGEPIQSGLQLNDLPTILSGAVPAALMALLVQGLFVGLDRWAIPRGLRVRGAGE